jgi:hypothetical protein
VRSEKCQQRTLASAAGSGHSGFAIGLFNRRGVTARMPTDGGGQERDEAAKYRSDAKPSALLAARGQRELHVRNEADALSLDMARAIHDALE